LLEEHNIEKIDLLSIDTEGTELDVWNSMDWERHKPSVVIVEAVSQREINVDILPVLEKLGYTYMVTVGPNLIFQYTQIVRKPHQMIYGSSYDRGLEHLLKMWPDIRKEVPDATLRVCYGWNLFDRVYGDNPERQAWKEKINKLMEQEGITHLGRISHYALIQEHEKAGVWAYPTHFGEISCITAMRAQCYGSVPCVINYAALRETVRFGVKIEGDIYEPEVKKLYCDSLIALLKDEKYQEDVRKEMMSWARDNYSWRRVAEQWSDEFKSEVSPEEVAMRLILQDQPIEALKMLPEGELRKKLLKKLDHIINPESYKKKYADDPMNWRPGTINYPRHDWILKEAQGAKNLIDLGCYEGSLVAKAGKSAVGVEMCKAAVEDGLKRGLLIYEGDACTFQDPEGEKYDAVCACEIIEHVPSATKLIKNMLSLVSSNGWCYLTTPNGPYDIEGTKKVWEDENALIDHVRCFDKKLMEELMQGFEYKIVEDGKELYVKFRFNLAKEVELLMENNQALQAWNLVKDTDSPLKERVWLNVKHAFNKEDYQKYYKEDLREEPVPEEYAADCGRLYPRFDWLIKEIVKKGHKKVLDLGCADGYLGLTLAKKGIESLGFNLHKASVEIARERAEKFGLPGAKFTTKDIFESDGSYDAVVLFEIIEHLPDPQAAIDHAMKRVKKGGSLYISTPSQDSLGIRLHKEEPHEHWDDGKPSGHLQIFTEDQLRDMCKKYKVNQFVVDSQGNYILEVSHV
jgi:2-polyprenyl-3-methyl-5-hydroxy-6-metoxy-1,4-benzoquinol methylase